MTILATTFVLMWPSPGAEFTDYASFNYPTTVTTKVTYVHHHHHKRRVQHVDPPMNTALASWYALHGGGACGVGDVQNGYRFASLSLPCGAQVRFCYSSCVTAIMSDRGPYVSGRTFDLNESLKNAIGCTSLCEVRWRVT
jgi:hypothetical protein